MSIYGNSTRVNSTRPAGYFIANKLAVIQQTVPLPRMIILEGALRLQSTVFF
jgi:hypothetical protein